MGPAQKGRQKHAQAFAVSNRNALRTLPMDAEAALQSFFSGGWPILRRRTSANAFRAALRNVFQQFRRTRARSQNMPIKAPRSLDVNCWTSFKRESKRAGISPIGQKAPSGRVVPFEPSVRPAPSAITTAGPISRGRKSSSAPAHGRKWGPGKNHRSAFWYGRWRVGARPGARGGQVAAPAPGIIGVRAFDGFRCLCPKQVGHKSRAGASSIGTPHCRGADDEKNRDRAQVMKRLIGCRRFQSLPRRAGNLRGIPRGHRLCPQGTTPTYCKWGRGRGGIDRSRRGGRDWSVSRTAPDTERCHSELTQILQENMESGGRKDFRWFGGSDNGPISLSSTEPGGPVPPQQKSRHLRARGSGRGLAAQYRRRAREPKISCVAGGHVVDGRERRKPP